ncbi:MAG: ATP-binding protein [Actinomycetota bacterium]|nr:ATP-binding protein [Actinomycetota bacterium]
MQSIRETGLDVRVDTADHDLVEAATLADIVEGLRSRALNRSTAVSRDFAAPLEEIVPSGFTVVRTDRRSRFAFAYATAAGAALAIRVTERTSVAIYADTDQRLLDVTNDVAALLAVHEPPESDELDIKVWAEGFKGEYDSLHIPKEPWEMNRRNYATSTARGIDPLMELSEAPSGGKLLLWYGSPGTGKSHAVTSLASAWAPWCETHLVTDAEQFFTDPTYLRSIVESGPHRNVPHFLHSYADEATDKPPKAKLIVCEDADEYLRVDARERSGPALGRLLNLTDGLYGRDRDCYVLLTTNDDIARLHPAVIRPGRCLSQVEFPALSAAEARAWSGDPTVTRDMTIAELFARGGGRRVETTTERIGAYL